MLTFINLFVFVFINKGSNTVTRKMSKSTYTRLSLRVRGERNKEIANVATEINNIYVSC